MIPQVRAVLGLSDFSGAPRSEGFARLLAPAAQGERHDKRLWTGVARVTGAGGDTTALVGTGEQVADALLDYYDLGISTFLIRGFDIRGFDPLEDTIQYGRELIPLVREAVASRPLRSSVAA
jgi:alkanesulfonate monooxygenase